MALLCSCHLCRAKPEPGVEPNWRTQVNEGHRYKMVLRLFVLVYPTFGYVFHLPRSVEALTSCMTPEYLKEREDDVKSLARRIEDELFRKATSKDEYYTILAQKIFKLNQAASQSLTSVRSWSNVFNSALLASTQAASATMLPPPANPPPPMASVCC